MTTRAALIAAALAVAACSHAGGEPARNTVALPRATGVGPDQPGGWQTSPAAYVGERNRCVDRELGARQLNEFGDPEGTTYPGGSPLLGLTGRAADRYEYVMRHRPEIGSTCSRAPGEPQR